MKSRKIFWSAFSALCFLAIAAVSYGLLAQWKVYTKGKIVKVTVFELPSPFATHGNIKFLYEGKMYMISSSGNTILNVGDTMQLKYLESEHMFKFPDDDPMGWGILVILMFLTCGIAFLSYALKKK